MTNTIIINDKNRTIEMTKKFANAAKRYGSDEYYELQGARKDYPKYKVITKSTARKKGGFKGLTYDYMEKYIKDHNKEKSILPEFYTLCGKDEDGNAIEDVIEIASYGEVKKWFLEQYSIFEDYRKNIDNILKKTA